MRRLLHEPHRRGKDSLAAAGRAGGTRKLQAHLQEHISCGIPYSSSWRCVCIAVWYRARSSISSISQWHETRFVPLREKVRNHPERKGRDERRQDRPGIWIRWNHRCRGWESFLPSKYTYLVFKNPKRFIKSPVNWLKNFWQIKTQLQSQSAKSIAVGFQHHHSGALDAFKHIWKEGGVFGLYRGWYANLPKTFVGSATQLTIFGLVTDWLRPLEVCWLYLTGKNLLFNIFNTIRCVQFFSDFRRQTFVSDVCRFIGQWLLFGCGNATFWRNIHKAIQSRWHIVLLKGFCIELSIFLFN